MEERIKELRKALGLTQQEFSDRIGVKRNTIAQYESGRNAPIDAVITLICRTYNVSEDWLRTGEGEMFVQRTRDEELAAFFGDVLSGEPDFWHRLITVLSRLSTEEWVLLEQVADKLIAEMQTEGQD